MKELIVSSNDAGQRFDKYIMKYLNKAPKSFIYKMLRKKNIILNGKKSTGSEILKPSDSIKLFLSDDTVAKFSQLTVYEIAKKINLNVIYQSKDVLFLNKPANLLSQKARPDDISINEQILSYLLQEEMITEESLRTFRPSICNRLDRNTTGLITAGVTLFGSQELSCAFRERSMKKYYIAIVKGDLNKNQVIKGYLYKNTRTNKVTISENQVAESEFIETGYKTIWSSVECSMVEVHLITGKTHQIRAHLSSIGHPIIGDIKYGNQKNNDEYRRSYGVTSQLLHAYSLQFPAEGVNLNGVANQTFIAPLPKIFATISQNKRGSHEHLEFERP